jgi:hypothetical protein
MLAPVNGLAASFTAELPDPQETRVARAHTDWVRGLYAFRGRRLSAGRRLKANHFRDVFDAYYTPSVEKGLETAPHILFARCADDPDSIIQFTNEWGPLHDPRTGNPQSGFDPIIFTEDELRDKHKFFSFTLFWWRGVQKQFRETMERLAAPDFPAWQNGMQESGPIHSSTFHFQIVKKDNALAPQVTVDSLIEALWLMLWLDTAEGSRRIRVCANTRCKEKFFRAGRADQIYCCNRCKECVNKRKYWTLKGSTSRRESRSTGRRRNS